MKKPVQNESTVNGMNMLLGEFADNYAQTVTFSFLLARSLGANTLDSGLGWRGAWPPQGRIKCKKSVTQTPLPEGFSNDEAKQVLQVGDGEFSLVPPAVYDYEVSGLKVVQSWLGNRTGKGKGKKSSPLDDIQPERWTAEFTSELLRLLNLLNTTLAQHEKQSDLLNRILAARLINAGDLGPPPDETRNPLEQNGYQNGFWDKETDD